MSVFEAQDYKAYINARISENTSVRGYRSLLAQAAGCQKSFFSQVTNSHIHLTPDHAVGLCEFWSLDPTETEYFLALVDHARAGSPKLRAILSARMRRISEGYKNLTKRITSDEIRDPVAETLYHSSWYWVAIHVIVSISKYQTVNAISSRLGLEPTRVTECLQGLEKIGLVRNQRGRWSVTNKTIHLDRKSPMRETNHTQWRQRAILDIQSRREESIHYNAVFAMSVEDAAHLHEIVTAMILRSREVIRPSVEEELYCLSTDFFRV